MAHSIENPSADNQIPLLPQTEKDEEIEFDHEEQIVPPEEREMANPKWHIMAYNEPHILRASMEPKVLLKASMEPRMLRIPQTEKDEIEEGSKGDHLINIPDTNPSCTIFKVNVWLRESNPDAYTPKMVSIGPYHNKKPQLHAMEKNKKLYLQRFLGRRVGLDKENYISELEKLKEKAINCYEDVEDDGQFCQMLLLDGCFVVEFLRERCGMWPEGEDKYKYIINRNAVHIFRDLILLENQLPFFVLDKLHDMTKRDGESLLEMLLKMLACINWLPFFVDLPETNVKTILKITRGNIKHLLHFKHVISCLGNHMKKPEVEAGNRGDNDDPTWHMIMPNVTELSEAGVSFAKSTVETGTFDSIKFENGSMKVPWFRVTDNVETLLRNLIAYEQQSVDVEPQYFSNFAIFMDKLIDSDKDVNLLCHEGIIENWLGDDIEVANLFNKIGNGVLISDRDFYYKEECRKAVKHCKKPWNKMKANLLRNYFSSPWVGASTATATILVIFQLIQTIQAFIDPINK